MKKRIIIALLSLCMMAVLFPVSVYADSERCLFRLQSLSIENQDRDLHFVFAIDDSLVTDDSQFDSLDVFYENEQSKERVSYTIYSNQLTGNNQQWIADVQTKFKENGKWNLKAVVVTDNKNRTYDASQDINLANYSLNITEIIKIEAPVINSMSFTNDLSKPINSGQSLNINIDSIVKFSDPTYVLVYYNETNHQLFYLNASYDSRLKQYIVNLPKEMQYLSEKFTFLFVESYCSAFDIDPAYTLTEFNRYTPMSQEHFSKYAQVVENGHHDFDASQVNYNADITNMDLMMNYSEDSRRPEIVQNTLKWENKTIVQPGTAKLQYQVTDFGGSKVCRSYVIYECDDKVLSEYPTQNSYVESYNDNATVNIEFPISRYTHAQGKFRIIAIVVEDNAGYKSIYIEDENDIEKIEEHAGYIADGDFKITHFDNNLTFKQYQNYEKILVNSDPTLLQQLEQCIEGKTYVIDYSQQSIVLADVFKSIQGKDITLVFDTNQAYKDKGIQWVINGKDITQPKDIDLSTELKAINLKIENDKQDIDVPGYYEFISRQTANEKFVQQLNEQQGAGYYLEYLKQFDIQKDNFYEQFVNEFLRYERALIVFKKNGELPGKMTIRYNPDYTMRGYINDEKLNCYYVHDGEYELVQEDIEKSLDGCFEFTITHNSTYILQSEKIKNIETPSHEDDPIITPEVNPDDESSVIIPDEHPSDNIENVIDHHENTTSVQTGDQTSLLINCLFILLAGTIIYKVSVKMRKQ